MNLEEKIFKKAQIKIDKLMSYGFKEINNSYIYSKKILNNTFKIIIEIDCYNKIKGKIIDANFDEEYLNYRNENLNGEFINKVREEFKKVLFDIKDKCCTILYFGSEQTNRVADFIINYYHTTPEFPWKKNPDCGIFRHANNKKWYALIMNVKRGKIENNDNIEKVEVINLKLNEEKISQLLNKKGFYKAYHMNKKKWITIILDNTIEDEEIIAYIKESYNLTCNKK